jgi:hypothetical protein
VASLENEGLRSINPVETTDIWVVLPGKNYKNHEFVILLSGSCTRIIYTRCA